MTFCALYLCVVSDPSKCKFLAHINKHAKDKKIAYENILWALLNTKEFQFNQ